MRPAFFSCLGSTDTRQEHCVWSTENDAKRKPSLQCQNFRPSTPITPQIMQGREPFGIEDKSDVCIERSNTTTFNPDAIISNIVLIQL
jgi:hypothetical protein